MTWYQYVERIPPQPGDLTRVDCPTRHYPGTKQYRDYFHWKRQENGTITLYNNHTFGNLLRTRARLKENGYGAKSPETSRPPIRHPVSPQLYSSVNRKEKLK